VLGGERGFDGLVVGALDRPQALGDLGFAGGDGLAVLPAVGAFGEVLGVIQGERAGVVDGGRVCDMTSPARRSRAGLGVQGVAGVLILS